VNRSCISEPRKSKLPTRPNCLLGNLRKMLTRSENKLAKFTAHPDISRRHSVYFAQYPSLPLPPALLSMMIYSFLAGWSSLNQSAYSRPTSGQGTEFPMQHLQNEGSWSHGTRVLLGVQMPELFAITSLAVINPLIREMHRDFGVCQLVRSHAAPASTVAQCVYNLW
jgi:hypothetical protein